MEIKKKEKRKKKKNIIENLYGIYQVKLVTI